ncbi:MAG: phosphatase PAP2 family protein [Gemmataceae bacterium]
MSHQPAGNEQEPGSGPRPLRERVRQALILAAIMLASLGGYLTVERWRGHAPVFITKTRLDEHIPFQHEWVWIYLIPYLIGPIVVGLLSRDTFRWFIRRGLVVVIASLAFFVLIPTQVVRPTVDVGDGLTAKMYRDMVAIDEPPANAAPSLHVSLTCLLAWAVRRDYPRWTLVAFGVAAVVWLSTLLTHQHHLIDVGTGVALASLAAWPWRIR